MSAMTSRIADVSIVCSTVCSGADQRKHQSSASLAFVGGIHRSPVNSPHKGPVTPKMFPFNDVIMYQCHGCCCPGDASRKDIISHCIDPALQRNFGFNKADLTHKFAIFSRKFALHSSHWTPILFLEIQWALSPPLYLNKCNRTDCSKLWA